MKRITITFTIFLLSLAPIFSQNVTIPDANFLAALIEKGVDTNEDGQISYNEAEVLTSLSVNGSVYTGGEIADLTGVEAFTNLTSLFCSNNQLTSLDISNNTALEHVQCGGNKINYLDVTNCNNLRILSCKDNFLSQLELSSCDSLESLNCGNNMIAELNLSNKSLKHLYCSFNNINYLDLSKIDSLKSLHSRFCGLQDVLLDNPVLEEIDFGSYLTYWAWIIYGVDTTANLTHLDLSNCPALESLNCAGVQLKALNISQNTLLKKLEARNNQLEDIQLSNNPLLTDLSLSNNPLSTLDISNNNSIICNEGEARVLNLNNMPQLGQICVSESFDDGCDVPYDSPNAYFTTECTHETIVFIPDANFLAALIARGVDTNEDGQISIEEAEAVSKLDISGRWDSYGSITDMTGIEAFINLDTLACTYNNLTNLDVTKNKALVILYCGANQLTNLDVSNNTSLVDLQCGSNKLTSLDVSKNIALKRFICHTNPLTSLNFSDLTELETIWCTNNQLSSLNVSGCTSVSDIDCHNNHITSLDVSDCFSLANLDCRHNNLTSLDISGCNALFKLDCNGNQLINLDITNNTELHWLSCFDNQLTSLDVSSNNSLTFLQCHNNKLTSLNFSDLTELETIWCSNNQLTYLDVSDCRELSELCCFDNLMTDINLSSCSSLSYLDCSRNLLKKLDISNNINLFNGYWWTGINLSEMQELQQVCVWELPFPPSGTADFLDTTGSPKIVFDTICGWLDKEDKINNLLNTEINFYPNPTNSLLTIETDQPDYHSIEITSLNGQMIYRADMEGNSKQIDLSPFSKGIYFITIRSKDFVTTRKIIKL